MSTDLPLSTTGFHWNEDCRHFQGGLPCRHWRACPGCPHHDPITYRVLIVMLKRLGDMLIASPLPTRIRDQHPGAHITWLVGAESAPLVEMIACVDRVLVWGPDTAQVVLAEHYDEVLSFERDPAVAGLVPRISAEHRAGLAYGGPHNSLYPIGAPARHFFAMNTWNDFRTRGNEKTWTELYFEVAGFLYTGEPYQLVMPEDARARVTTALGTGGWICLNIGGSKPTKQWPVENWIALGRRLLGDGHRLLVTGGPADREVCAQILAALDTGVGRVRHDPWTLAEFVTVPQACAVMVTGDSFGFHLALAHDLPVVVLFGPSNPAEVVPRHADTVTVLRSSLGCSPCAHQVTCGGVGGCMETVTVTAVHTAITNHLAPTSPAPQEV